MGSTDEDVVMALKGRWARALGLDDDTMSTVALEKATREQKATSETKGRDDERAAVAWWLRLRLDPDSRDRRMLDMLAKEVESGTPAAIRKSHSYTTPLVEFGPATVLRELDAMMPRCASKCDGDRCDRIEGHAGKHTTDDALWVTAMEDAPASGDELLFGPIELAEQELRRQGIDPAEVRAKGDAIGAALLNGKCGAPYRGLVCCYEPGHPGPHTAANGKYWDKTKAQP